MLALYCSCALCVCIVGLPFLHVCAFHCASLCERDVITFLHLLRLSGCRRVLTNYQKRPCVHFTETQHVWPFTCQHMCIHVCVSMHAGAWWGFRGYGLFHPGPYSEGPAEREAERRMETLLWSRWVSEVPRKIDSLMGGLTETHLPQPPDPFRLYDRAWTPFHNSEGIKCINSHGLVSVCGSCWLELMYEISLHLIQV